MWIKMDEERFTSFLDEQVASYKSTKWFYFLGGTMVMFILAIILSFALFYPNQLFLNKEVPGGTKAILYVLGTFSLLESILLCAMAIDFIQFGRMSQSGKRSRLSEHLKKHSQKICPTCYSIYDFSEVECLKCKSKLESSFHYLWTDD